MLYFQSLVKEFKSNNRGKFLDTILGLMNSTAVFLAKDLRSAIKVSLYSCDALCNQGKSLQL